MQRNLPDDLELLPEVYKKFNILANQWLKREYPECEKDDNSNSQDYRCKLLMYSNAKVGNQSFVIVIGDESWTFDTIKKILAYLDSKLNT